MKFEEKKIVLVDLHLVSFNAFGKNDAPYFIFSAF